MILVNVTNPNAPEEEERTCHSSQVPSMTPTRVSQLIATWFGCIVPRVQFPLRATFEWVLGPTLHCAGGACFLTNVEDYVGGGSFHKKCLDPKLVAKSGTGESE